jgi:hypothetical protein
MKKMIAVLLVALMVFGMFGCSQPEDQPATTGIVDTMDPAATVATENPETQAATEAPATELPTTESVVQGSLYLNASSMTFTLVGESDDLYCGSIPRELIIWESADETVATVDNGVVTAVGVGEAYVIISIEPPIIGDLFGSMMYEIIHYEVVSDAQGESSGVWW